MKNLKNVTKKMGLLMLAMAIVFSSFVSFGIVTRNSYAKAANKSMGIKSVYAYQKDTNRICGDIETYYPGSDRGVTNDNIYGIRWSFSKDKEHWYVANGWGINDDNSLNWYPPEYGTYYIKVEMMDISTQKICDTKKFIVEFNPNIKGICQMPNPRGDGGYLIGIESYDNPNNKYDYEMLILDCTLLAEGKDAWIYSTGKCGSDSNCLWTVWQPLYGYYWTLFRIYDKVTGQLIDQKCYGFANIDDPNNNGIVTQPDDPWLLIEEPTDVPPEDYEENLWCRDYGHLWEIDTQIIHHDAEYEERITTEYKEELVTVTICNQCGEEITDAKEHMKQSGTTPVNVGTEENPWWIDVPNCSSCHTEGRIKLVPYEKVEQVLVKEAWDEVKIVGYKCVRCEEYKPCD